MRVVRSNFDKALQDLQHDILRMGSMVEEAIANAVKALARQDEELAEKIIVNEQAIDQLELDIEDKCLKLIATQQPMAKDLRRIGTGFKIITDLERMADHAYDIAKIVKRIGKEPLIKPLIDIPAMAELAQKMVKRTLDAYVNEDVDLAQSLATDDDQVDRLHKMVFDELAVLMAKRPQTINQATHLLMVSRYLERIADHATNIGEGVIFLVTGERKQLND